MATPNSPFEQIIVPEQIPSAWPPAPIYWIIAGVVIAFIGLALFLFKRHQQKQRVIKQALKSLAELQKNQATFAQLNQLLKGLCLHFYARPQVASLTGKEWFIFINQHALGNSPMFVDQQVFCERLYQQDAPCEAADFTQSKRWIKGFPAQVLNLQKKIKVGK